MCWAQYGGGYAGVEEGLGCSVREAGGRQELGRSEAVRGCESGKEEEAMVSSEERGEGSCEQWGAPVPWATSFPSTPSYGTQAFSSWSVMEPPLSP